MKEYRTKINTTTSKKAAALLIYRKEASPHAPPVHAIYSIGEGEKAAEILEKKAAAWIKANR